MTKKLTVLVSFCNEAGHLNACVGSTLALLQRGHRVIFLTHEAWKGKLSSLGYEEHIYTGEDLKPNQNPADAVAEKLEELKIVGPFSSKEKLRNIVKFFQSGPYEKKLEPLNVALKVAIAKYRPDVIIIDDHSVPPEVQYSGIPWIKSISMAPLFEMFDPELPPGGSGLPLDGDRSEWPEYNAIRRNLFYSKVFNDAIEKWGYQRYADEMIFPPTQILTIYACPEELNYPQIRATGWFNLESFNKVDAGKVKIDLNKMVPESFLADTFGGKFSGKLIFISMGSMGSVDLVLMNRLVSILGKTNHKYIVSKGPNHDKYELASNMWGEKFLPQTALLPYMHLVITHGGNNTVTETFAQGKKMIVMPLFADQFDNAQRLNDTGLGVRVDPYTIEADKLIEIVDRMLVDDKLEARLQAAYKRIQASDAHQQLADKIEQLLTSN